MSKIPHTGDIEYLDRCGIVVPIRKNPANGRQSISRPMQIVAPITKNYADKAKFTKKMCGDLTT